MKRIELDKNVIDEIIRLYNEEMLGSPSISEKLGINRHIVLRVLKENNIKVGVPGQKFKGGKYASYKRNCHKHKDKKNEYHKEWSKENRDRLNEYHKEWRDKYSNYFNMVGYSAEQLKEHLEKRFKDDMSWENYGEWHIDHIKPISSFVFESVDDKEFKECWSLDNLQPMWGVENIKKGNRIF
jgi:hypothetical protein